MLVQQRAIRRGDMWLVKEPVMADGSQYRKERPWVVCQSPLGSESPIILAAPISASEKKKAHNFLQQVTVFEDSQIHYESITPVPRERFIKWIGKLSVRQIEEMDMRLCVPLDLAKTSILHIEKVVLKKKVTKGSDLLMFSGEVQFKFYSCAVTFTSKDFESFFGRRFLSVLDRDVSFIQDFLESLNGLKFLYSRMHK